MAYSAAEVEFHPTLGNALKTLKLPLPLNTIAVVSLFVSLACVNRGSHTDITTPGGDSGAGGHIVPMGDAALDQEPMQDSGVDTVVVDSCEVDGGSVDAGDAGPPSSCTAMFNFESPGGCGLYGAVLGVSDNPPATAGFTNLRHSPVAVCGRGAMAVDVDFDLSARLGGEIIIPVSSDGSASYSGKTLTISVMGSVDGGAMRFYVYLIAGTFQPVLITPITTSWQTFSIPLPTPDASADNVMSISLEAFGRGSAYKGTLYIDEIDVRKPLPDAGSGDGPSDVPAMDARDGGAGDVRDAPAGS